MATPLLLFARSTLLCLLLLSSVSFLGAEEPAQLPFRDTKVPIEKRVDDLVGRLTVEEKVAQLMMATPAIPRLGIPAYHWWNEALHGVARNGIATVFPQAIGLAATWNPELHHQIAEAISTEARAKNNDAIRRSGGDTKIYEGLSIWSPNINIFRDPRWGRGQETYGEDPFLTGRFGVAFVRGLKGDDPRYLKTVATLKHFAVHSGPEKLRHKFDAQVSQRDLRETYLPAFEAGIREGGALSIMSAYNAIGGIPAPANKFLLTDLLRKEWGFKGAVVGDVDTVKDIFAKGSHEYAKDFSEASALALKAGNDLCSGGTYHGIPGALAQGLLTQADLDRALRCLFTLRFRLGQFDSPEQVPFTRIALTDNNSPAHDQLALEAARQSLVLLKNDGALPWNPKSIKTLAVIGPTAQDNSALIGNYAGTPAHPVNLLAGLKKKLAPLGVKIIRETGSPLVTGFREKGNPIPEGVLFTDETKKIPGLKGELFAKSDFSGSPTATRIDPDFEFFWNEEQPSPGLPVRDVNMRWSGVIVPPKTAEYQLSLNFAGVVKLFVDDQLVAKQDQPAKNLRARSLDAKVNLVGGKAHRVRIEYSQGESRAGQLQFGWAAPGGMEDALAAARKADHILLTLGITPNLEGEEMPVSVEGFDRGDRVSIQLPKCQQELISQIAALGKPFVVVLTSGSPLSFDITKPNAILQAWYYGQRGGDAVADVLCGDTNPAGRLPITFYQSEQQLPAFEDYSMANRTYRYFTGKPLFAFGHGLSYTTFDYAPLALSAENAKRGNTVNVNVTVTNSGKRDGDEVVQVYAKALKAPVPMPLQSLVGFQRASIKAGEKKVVSIPVKVESLRRWDESKAAYVVDPGSYELRVGPASDNIAQKATLKVD